MDLRKHIKDNYGTIYKFCKEKEVTPQRVNYWLTKDWERLNYLTREKIKTLL